MMERVEKDHPRVAVGSGGAGQLRKPEPSQESLHSVNYYSQSLHRKYASNRNRHLSSFARVFRAALVVALWASPKLAGGLSSGSSEETVSSEVAVKADEDFYLTSEIEKASPPLYGSNESSEPQFASGNVVSENVSQGGSDLKDTQQPSGKDESFQIGSEDVPATPVPMTTRGLDEIVPFLLPMQPYAPRFSGINGLAEPSSQTGSFDSSSSISAHVAFSPFAFYGPQSDELQVDNCQHFDAFLVSPLPSSVASKFSDFVKKEEAQADGMPYLHHIHGRPSDDPADGEENPRLVVEGGKVTPLWSEYTEDNPTFSMDEGTITLIRLVAPVKSAYDAVASMMLMPIIDASISYGDGLLLSYKVSGEEGRQADHQHQDGTHRPVAELDVAYKSCFSVGGQAIDPIPVRAELRFGGCEPVVLMWKVICSNGAFMQAGPTGFNISIGPLTPPQNKDAASLMRSTSDLPWDPSLCPSPTVGDIRAVISNEGDLVTNGAVSPHVSTVQAANLVFDSSQDFVEIYAWCHGCKDGKLDMQIPTIAADLQVVYPLLYNFVGSSKREETETEQAVSLVASRPSSHVVLKEALPGSEENVRRLVVQFQCKSEGESIMALDFAFHGYRDIQIFMKKKCAAPASASLRDPSCSSGILSDDGTGCCVASCGTCGGDGCEDREGGLAGCCLTHIVSSALPCTITTAPCILGAHQSKIMKELQSNLPLPEENTNQRFSLLLAPLWLIGVGLALIKLIIWCMAAGAILIYAFTVCYGLYALKDPFLVAAAPSATQLFNAVCLIGGHMRYLYKIHSSTVFGGDAFHSYTPFEERAQVKPSKLSNKDNPFRPPVTWRSNDDNGSFIRLTSFKAKPADEPDTHPSEALRPMEFCDMEADGHHVGDGQSAIDDSLWEGPQGDFQADSWVDDTTSTFSRLSEQGFPTQQISQHYRNLPSSQYEPF